MNSKKKLKTLIIISVLVFISGLIAWYPDKLGICNSEQYSCFDAAFSYGKPIVFFTFVTTILFAILLAFKESVIQSWLKLTILIPLALFWVFMTPTYCGSLICFDRNDVAWFTAILFAGISLIFVGVKSLSLKKKGTEV